MGGYTDHDVARWVSEAPKRAERTDFARDRARVLHSASWRRLAERTQVLVAGSHDFPRTRMTHSLECAQVGRELGDALGCDPDLVEAACLAHDLGHPPFGHTGEAALDHLAADIGGFEGNAQTLRILTRLEPRVFLSVPGRSVGLNLTRAALDAACKYPWPRRPETPKFGVYAEDSEAFEWLRRGAPRDQRCFEAQIMDWADDVAYSVHDVEDGIHLGLVDPRALRDPATTEVVCALAREVYLPHSSLDELRAAYDRLRPRFPYSFDGSRRDQAAVKNLTSSLIGRFSRAAERATRAAHPQPALVRYAATLHVPREVRDEVAVLKSIAHHFVMRRSGVARAQARQQELIAELVHDYRRHAPAALDPEFRADWHAATDEASALRVVIDQVATLTDTSAIARARTRAGHRPRRGRAAGPQPG